MSISAEDVAARIEVCGPCNCENCEQARRDAALVRSLERIRVAANTAYKMRGVYDQQRERWNDLGMALDAHRKEFGS